MPPDNSTFYNILRHRQLEYTEDGRIIKKEQSERDRARMALRKQHNRHNKPRKQVTLDELMGQIGGTR